MVNRRSFLGTLVHAIFGTITAIVGVVLGGAVLRPAKAARAEIWADAGALEELVEGLPKEIAVRVERVDGYFSSIERRVMYLVRTGAGVKAYSTTCTHLGCRVSWHGDAKLFKCPCHGGQFTLAGQVVAGPPPRGLDEVPSRTDGDRVMVRVG